MARPARCQHEIEHVREDILHAAGRAFSRQGFEAVTIHDIAQEAGYTTPSLYAYFKGKQEIIDALIAAVAREFECAFEAEMPPALSFHQRLALLFERFFQISDHWPEVRPLLFEIKRSETVRFKQAHQCASKQSMDARLGAWLRKNMTSGQELGGREPEELVHIIRSLIFGAFLPGCNEGARGSTPRDRFTLALQVCLYGISGLEKRA